MGYQVKPRFLMCRPDHFGVVYAINPWMNPQDWREQEDALASQSRTEWAGLRAALIELGAGVELVPAASGLPDLVFTANGAVVLDRTALLARFRHPQRQAEENHFASAFRSMHARGLIDTIRTLPEDLVLEGAGDCVFDASRNLFWMGYGPRSDKAARHVVAQTFGVEVVPLQLVDARFYHLDTALCPLPRGELLYVPGAFTPEGLAAMRERVAPEQRIEVDEADACRLAANAVCVGDAVVMSGCGEDLRMRLAQRGYRVVATPLEAFQRSGGSAFCLTLRLDRTSAKPAQAAQSPKRKRVSAGSR